MRKITKWNSGYSVLSHILEICGLCHFDKFFDIAHAAASHRHVGSQQVVLPSLVCSNVELVPVFRLSWWLNVHAAILTFSDRNSTKQPLHINWHSKALGSTFFLKVFRIILISVLTHLYTPQACWLPREEDLGSRTGNLCHHLARTHSAPQTAFWISQR